MRVGSLAVCLALAASARAQDNTAAGLFAEARQLPLVSQTISVRIAAGQAELRLVQVFANDGAAVAQADYHLYVPQGATVTGFGFWNQGEYLAAVLREREEAEQRHRQAATEGRATGLLKQENRIHSFSVYPLAAGELKTVETVFQLPAQRELGRSRVRVPVDAFLGQPGPSSILLVDLTTEEPIEEAGAEGAQAHQLSGGERRREIALTARGPVELWWRESGPPLQVGAELVPLAEGGLGLRVRVALGTEVTGRRYTGVHLLLDGSYSMRRRTAALRALIERLQRAARVPLTMHLVADGELRFEADAGVDAALSALEQNAAGHQARWERFTPILGTLACGVATRCLVVTDAQLEGLEQASHPGAAILILADPHEHAWASARIPAQAAVFLPGVDPEARLLELADQAVLPVFTLRGLSQEGQPVPLPSSGPRRVALGGLLRAGTRTASRSTVIVEGDLDGEPQRFELVPQLLDPHGPAGAALRRAIYEDLLAAWMDAYRRAPDPDLKRQMVEVSLRENVPTAFTALQVDDPRLSLASIKPGDPLAIVPEEPGLREVVVWYPFGELRRMIYDPERRAFVDRFLVPRGWRQGPYAVELFKHYQDGTVRQVRLWYDLDEQAPQARVSLDPGSGLVRVDTGASTRQVSQVQVHTSDGRVLSLSPAGSAWGVPAVELTARFTVVLRDAAGNRAAIDCELGPRAVRTLRSQTPAQRVTASETVATLVAAGAGSLRQDGDTVVLTIGERQWRVAAAELRLRSLDLRALHHEGERVVFGTAAGDLVELECAEDGACHGASLSRAFAHHPVVGLAPMGPGRLMVGVLGRGLYELCDRRLLRVHGAIRTRSVTGVAAFQESVYIGTANDGLWRWRRGRLSRVRFPHQHVAGLQSTTDSLLVQSGFGRYRLAANGKLARWDDGIDALERGSQRLTASVEWQGRLYVGAFDTGVLRLGPAGLEAVEWGLSVGERQVNAMATYREALWLGTEGGLVEIPADPASPLRRHLSAAVHGLSVGPQGLAIASADGVQVLRGHGNPRRWGGQSSLFGRGAGAVAWWQGVLYAGGTNGLARIDEDSEQPVGAAAGFPARWVTALAAAASGLLIGTYDEGVYRLHEGRVERVSGLEAQWVPPNGLSVDAAGVWAGGIGMPPARLEGGRVVRWVIPAEDAYSAQADDGGALLLTSAGALRISTKPQPGIGAGGQEAIRGADQASVR